MNYIVWMLQMKEKTVRLIMIKYFDSKGIKVRPSRGAGPDLTIDGKAVEVKGSKIDFDRMLRQLLDYAYRFSDLALALPFDGLTLKRITQLRIFGDLIQEARKISLKVYMIAPHPEQKNLFYVYDSPDIGGIMAMMTTVPYSELGFSLKDPDSTIGNAVENLLKYSPVQNPKRYICTDYDHKVSKVQI